eukprot:PITA_04118
MSTIIQNEPSSFSDAVKHQVWKDAMTEEYESIMKNDVWEVVPRPQDKTMVTSKWLYKIKHATDGSTEKYKARFVARVFSQKKGIDYDEIFAPVARYTTMRLIIALAASQGWNLHQMDVKTAFLHGSTKEEVYMEQPEGVEIYDRKSHVCKLKKALYGLKQAPRAWYERIDSYLMKLRFNRSEADPNLYFKVEDDKPLILVLYVDDLFLTGADPLIHKFSIVSSYLVEPHWIDAKNLLRCLRGRITYGLRYTAGNVRLLGYTDVDWAGNVEDRKSTSGCCSSLGSASISWMSRKQKLMAFSTAEAEYIAASMASCEVV